MRCMFGFHKWEQWTLIEEGEISGRTGNIVGFYYLQERKCSICGKTDRIIKKIKAA